ncbi:GrpB family protein [Kiloniella laminariae]|uniref:GrpB family protein n=1 Tax=Kiloniella laminariae TaxID=454162 RepID=A0ABT4LFQ2_9PROT|nr:GrpB family protein [Kiloniella laminariae]MCZ4279765.1 GrpB family protein [Kiloniella laminariae]
MSGPEKSIVVVDYDPKWPETFFHLKLRLEALLGCTVQEIVHIGSTAIPGLCAKPKIDVDVVLGAEKHIPQAIDVMKAAGYNFHGNKYNDGMWAFTTGRGSRGERVYLCAPENATHDKRLLFRDYLRAHPEEARRYGLLKRKLASETLHDWDYYTGGKGAFVTEIIHRAMAERVKPA